MYFLITHLFLRNFMTAKNFTENHAHTSIDLYSCFAHGLIDISCIKKGNKLMYTSGVRISCLKRMHNLLNPLLQHSLTQK